MNALPLTDPFSLTLGIAAAVLAFGVVLLQIPRPPSLDGQRWFKLALCTLLRGRFDATGATPEAWEAEVIRVVPYHPDGQHPERKVSNPVAAQAVGAEQGLLDALGKLEGAEARWDYLYDKAPAGRDARLSDPAELGEAYNFSQLGPGASWDTLAAWATGDGAFAEALARALPATWVLLSGRADRLTGPTLLEPLEAALEAIAQGAKRFPWDPDGLPKFLEALTDARLVVVAEEAAATELLRALSVDAALRDRVCAVVVVGGVIGGRDDEPLDGRYGERTCAEWLEANFDHTTLDTDIVRFTPYFCVQWLDRSAWPPGVAGLALQAARFPEPAVRDSRMPEIVEVVDLGPLPADRPIPVDLVAKALVAVVVAYTHSRR